MCEHNRADWRGIVLKSIDMSGGGGKKKSSKPSRRRQRQERRRRRSSPGRPFAEIRQPEPAEAVQEDNNDPLIVGGVKYATEGEALLADLLLKLGIPFTPNVEILINAGSTIYVVDFLFNRMTYVWRNQDGSHELVHGIEAKGAHQPEGVTQVRNNAFYRRRKVALLRRRRGINIKMLYIDEIRAFAAAGSLPLELYQ